MDAEKGIIVGKEALVAELRRRRFKTDGAFYFRRLPCWIGLTYFRQIFLAEAILIEASSYTAGTAKFKELSAGMGWPHPSLYRSTPNKVDFYPLVFAIVLSMPSLNEKTFELWRRGNEKNFVPLHGPREEVYFLYDESTKTLYFPDLLALKGSLEERGMVNYLRKSALKASSREQGKEGKAKNG